MTTYELVYPENSEQSYGVKAVKIFCDISADFHVVKSLVDTCNRSDVDVEFFPDILENFLTDYTF
ncbi:MAG: hypothetical protein IIU39_04850 [Ruminococcus sp.]|jgi:hypothetical protein|nr:hypothetical protein [Ruminococcus sp.]